MKLNRLFLILSALSLYPVVFCDGASGLMSIGDDYYQEMSEIQARKIISSLPGLLDQEFLGIVSEDRGEMEATAFSLLRRAFMFDMWNYTLSDLPMETIVEIVRLAKKYQDGSSSIGVILDKVEEFSVDKAIEYLDSYFNKKGVEISFGGIKGGVSGNNEEIVFQYLLIHMPGEGGGDMILRIYSPKEIIPPDSKGSYGGAISFSNLLSSGKKIGTFVLDIRGKSKKSSFNMIAWDQSKERYFDMDFRNEVLDFGIRPTTWQDRYIFSPIKDLVSSIPVIKDVITDNGKVSFLSGSVDGGLVKKEISSVLGDKKVLSADSSSIIGVGEKEEVVVQESLVVEKEHEEDKKEVSQERGLDNPKKEVPKAIKKKEEDEEVPNMELFEEKTDEESLGKETDVIRIIQELIKRRKADAKEVKLIEIEEEKEKEEAAAKKGCNKEGISESGRRRVIFNEIAWMGSATSSSAEWIELKNVTEKEIDIKGWRIYDNDSKIDILIDKHLYIPAQGFIVLERNEDAIPKNKADLLYSGALSNTKESLYLFAGDCTLEDMVKADPSWPAGDNKEKRTMERGDDNTWHDYSGKGSGGIMGTPGKKNSAKETTKKTGENPPSSNSSSNSSSGVSSTPVSYCNQSSLVESILKDVLINEVAWMGTLSSSNDEWIELRNLSGSKVSLSGWQLLDKDNNIRIVFEEGDSILPNGFYLLERTDDTSVPGVSADKIYSGALNDKEESLRLFDRDCHLVDSVTATPDWGAGNSLTKKSMERGMDGNSWFTYSGSGISGILGTPKQSNSTGNTEEKDSPSADDNDPPSETGEDIVEDIDNPDDEEGGEDIPDGDLSIGDIPEEEDPEGSGEPEEYEEEQEDDSPVENPSPEEEDYAFALGVPEVSGNRVSIDWNYDEEMEYQILYSFDAAVEISDFEEISSYVEPIIEVGEGRVIATIPHLYYGKEYTFVIKGIKEGSEDIFSGLVTLSTESDPGFCEYEGPDNSSIIRNLPVVGFSSYASKLISNSNGYLFGILEKDGGRGLGCLDANGELEWFYPSPGKEPSMGVDGTIYYLSDAEIFAVSPSGKLKWKTAFNKVISREAFIGQDGKIYFLAQSEDESYPDLYSVADMGSTFSTQEEIGGGDMSEKNSVFSFTGLVSGNDGTIYFGVDDSLVRLSGTGWEIRKIETEYSADYSSKKNYSPKISSIFVDEERIYLSADNSLVIPDFRFARIIALDIFDIQAEAEWKYVSNPNSILRIGGISGNHIYAQEKVGGSLRSISSISSSSGEKEWEKTWNDSSDRTLVGIDDRGWIYFKNGTKISAIDPVGISGDINTMDIVIGESIDIGYVTMGEDMLLVLPSKVFIIGKD
jgi:hypothetical protein